MVFDSRKRFGPNQTAAIFGVRRLDAAFFLSALGNEKRKKAASSRRTPKGRCCYKIPFLVKNLLRKHQAEHLGGWERLSTLPSQFPSDEFAFPPRAWRL